jgi:hypothetical protein
MVKVSCFNKLVSYTTQNTHSKVLLHWARGQIQQTLFHLMLTSKSVRHFQVTTYLVFRLELTHSKHVKVHNSEFITSLTSKYEDC